MVTKINWDLDDIDSFILSFASNTQIDNQSNAINCSNVIKNLVQEIMTMDYTTSSKTSLEVLKQTKDNKDLLERFEKLYMKVRTLQE